MRFGAQGGRTETEPAPVTSRPSSRFDDDDDEPFEQPAVFDRSGKPRPAAAADEGGKPARKNGFGSIKRKPADDNGFSRSSERATRKRTAPQAETVDADGYTRSSQQVQPRKSPRPDGPSLKMRAADYLSRREHSRTELARKLARWSDDRDEIDAVLDALTREGWMSTERFVQSVVHRRASRQGTTRIVQELRQHGIDHAEIEAVKSELKTTEFARARDVWMKRFGDTPPDREGWAKHARFLAARGFSHDVIRRVLGGEGGDDV
jgi:regulatory protein